MMKVISISVLCLVSALFVGIVLCALNGAAEATCVLGFAVVVLLWNYRVIRRKYARGL